MSPNLRVAFFDDIAEKWDGEQDLDALTVKLNSGLDKFNISANEKIIDVGCGTGNLTKALLNKLSDAGSIIAVDISSRMVDIARKKVPDLRVTWHIEEARRLSLGNDSCDRAICYSVWPHFDNHHEVALEFSRVLKPGGSLHVWHLMPRQKINEIHAQADQSVSKDILPSAEETAHVLQLVGFQIITANESDSEYLISAVKSE
ncbi:MAG: class I SAM-dependent methyltransferase [Deltaproteobacteria bacterium]|nr:class I SAM-dependent methyltransferase [Deltaproteobacteria bacterium]